MTNTLPEALQDDIAAIDQIDAVPLILDVVCRTTGMGFAAVARVTPDRWIACALQDNIRFGLEQGGELPVDTTICRKVLDSGHPVVIEHVAEDPAFRDHPTPALYGFQSSISVPIHRPNGSFFGTLCAIDPRPMTLNTPGTLGMFRLFADLIGFHLDARDKMEASTAALLGERETAELRDQFIAVLGHDLRNPVAAIDAAAMLLQRKPLDDEARGFVRLIRSTVVRVAKLIDDVLDFARGRLGDGLGMERDSGEPLAPALEQVVQELRLTHPDRLIEVTLDMTEPIRCDSSRLAQLLSNLLANALTYGEPGKPVTVRASTREGSFELSVANQGEPIPADALERLFLPFFRGANRSRHQGLGLGLYIASQIAQAHGGRIDVSSTIEETRFTFRMPV